MCSIMGIEGYDVDVDTFKQGFDATVSRGPDMSKIIPPIPHLEEHQIPLHLFLL